MKLDDPLLKKHDLSGAIAASVGAYCRGPWRPDVHFFHLFVTGYWGSMAGAFLAAFAAYFGLDVLEMIRSNILSISLHLTPQSSENDVLTKLAEKTYFLLFYLLGALFAWLAIQGPAYMRRVSPYVLCAASLGFLVPFHFLVAGLTRRQDINLVYAICAFVLLIMPLAIKARRRTVFKPAPDCAAVQPAIGAPSVGAQATIGWKFGAADLFAAVVLFLLIFPARPRDIASEIVEENHPVSFILGPSLYGFAQGLLPGKDFIALYGHGPSYIFRFFLSTDVNALYLNYIVFLTSMLLLFHLTSYFVLRDFFKERATALVVAMILVLLWHFGDGPRAYSAASSTPIRYIFIFISAAFLCRLLINPKGIHLVTCGLIGSLSLFWNTETGIYTLVVMHAAYIVLSLAEGRLPWRVVILTFTSALSSVLLFVGAFGPAVLDRGFLVSLIEPLSLHGVGNWVGVVMNWAPGWSYFYYTAMPAMAIATAVAVVVDWPNAKYDSRKERAYLVIFSLVALIFLVKWTNRSLDAVWQQNAFAFVVVLAWWARLGLRAMAERVLSNQGAMSLVGLSSVAVISLLWIMQDRGQPWVKTGLRAYLKFPSIAGLAWQERPRIPPVRTTLGKSEVQLVERYLSPGQPMLLVSMTDFLTLMNVGRAPKSYFLPFTDTFSSEHLARAMRGTDFIFLDEGVSFSFSDTWIADEFRCRLENDFEPVDRSDRFRLYKRKKADSNCEHMLCKPPLPRGAAVSFGTDAMAIGGTCIGLAFLKAGWGVPEKGGRWSVADKARLEVPTSLPANESVELKFDLSTYTGMGFYQGTQTVRAVVKGRILATWTFSPGSAPDPRIIVPPELRNADGGISITFEIDPPVNPRRLGLAPDDRELGISLRSLKIDSMR